MKIRKAQRYSNDMCGEFRTIFRATQKKQYQHASSPVCYSPCPLESEIPQVKGWLCVS